MLIDYAIDMLWDVADTRDDIDTDVILSFIEKLEESKTDHEDGVPDHKTIEDLINFRLEIIIDSYRSGGKNSFKEELDFFKSFIIEEDYDCKKQNMLELIGFDIETNNEISDNYNVVKKMCNDNKLSI